MIYLLHFSRPYKGRRHYIGQTGAGRLQDRMKEHREGRGSAFLRAVHLAGISWTVARLWRRGDRDFERDLKNRKNASLLCPRCSGPHALQRGSR